MRKLVCILLLLAQNLVCGAQTAPDSNVSAGIKSKPSSAHIAIVGFVPDFLKLNLDFSPDNQVKVVGYYPTDPAVKDETFTGTVSTFKIQSGNFIRLGGAVLLSNIDHSYTISVVSMNGGFLCPVSAVQEASIGYSLRIGDKTSQAENGVFRFPGSGKSTKGGIKFEVGIVLSDFNPAFTHAAYTDELSFSVTAD